MVSPVLATPPSCVSALGAEVKKLLGPGDPKGWEVICGWTCRSCSGPESQESWEGAQRPELRPCRFKPWFKPEKTSMARLGLSV